MDEEELESYAKQVDELQQLGDMSDITKYLKKAQQLDKKLQVLAKYISGI